MPKNIIAVALFFSSFVCFSADFVAGQDYELVQNSDTVEHKVKTPSVMEFFSFGCPWCYRLEPSVNKWVAKHGSKISFKKIPVVFNKDWEYYARAYYTAEALSLNSKLNPALFKAILDDKQPLNSNETMIAFLTKNGVDSATAQSAFNHSPSIDLDLATSQQMMASYHITAVPAFVVNNHYKTDLQMAKTEERLFAILDFLLAKGK